MLSLIFSHGHEICLIEQDVRRHQNGIIKESHCHILALFPSLVFKLRHPLQLRHAHQAVKNPSQLGVLRNVSLHEDCRELGIYSHCQIDTREFSCFLSEQSWILWDCDRVKINYAEEAFVFVLQGNPIAQRAQIISQMYISGWLCTAKDSLH